MSKKRTDPWALVWHAATSHTMVIVLLLSLAVGLMLTTWIPQQPSGDADYARWFSQVQARFGATTPVMRTLGLFNVLGSVWFRLLLALLAASLVLRLVEGLDQLRRSGGLADPDNGWRKVSSADLSGLLKGIRARRYRTVSVSSYAQVDRWPWAGLPPLIAHSGALVLLVGLLITHLWGWQMDGLVLQKDQRLLLEGGRYWVALDEERARTRDSAGVVSAVDKRGPGVAVRAFGEGDEPLQLQLTAESEPTRDLLVPLAEDRYFAVPEVELIAHLIPRSDTPYAYLDVEIYRSPPGEVIAELVTGEGGEAELIVDGVTLELTAAPYVEVTVSQNPGRWASAFGIVLLMGGLVASVAWPENRFWLRERDDSVEAAGSAPAWLFLAEEE